MPEELFEIVSELWELHGRLEELLPASLCSENLAICAAEIQGMAYSIENAEEPEDATESLMGIFTDYEEDGADEEFAA